MLRWGRSPIPPSFVSRTTWGTGTAGSRGFLPPASWPCRSPWLPPDPRKMKAPRACSTGRWAGSEPSLSASTYGGWILHREGQSGTLAGGCFTVDLKNAVQYGRNNDLIINQVVPNPHSWLEYLSAFDDGSVYYSFHYSFQELRTDRQAVV